MAEFDQTHIIAQYLDVHLVFPLLHFLREKTKLYKSEDILQQELKLLSKTHLIEGQEDVYKLLGKPVPEEVKQEKEKILSKLKSYEKQCEPLTKIFNNEQLVNSLTEKKQFNMEHLSKNFEGVNQQLLEKVYKFAKYQYECGHYSAAADLLYYYILLSTDQQRIQLAQWGKLASEILRENPDWDQALQDLNSLKQMIETHPDSDQLVQLQRRSWLIHWGLFVFFNHPNGKNGIVDLFFEEEYLKAIQINCPHILRYLAAAVIVNKKRKQKLRDLQKLVEHKHSEYVDPIIKFIEALYVDVDFEGAHEQLKKCEIVLANDYFLTGCQKEFLDNARLYIFENYCRIHKVVDISVLAEKLNIDINDAEKWIVNLIRNSGLSAKIDSKTNRVIMDDQYPNIYKHIVEKTEGYAFRTQNILSHLQKSNQQTVTE